jgi:lipopolysaccharide cholinephosphotransferase
VNKNESRAKTNNLFPDERNTGSSSLRKIQLIQLRMLKTIDYICRENNITYWLDGGTLLGAVRHGGFIPWDDDIDIVMPRPDYIKFIDIAKESLPKDMAIHTYSSSKNKDYYVPCKIIDQFSEILETTDNFTDIGRGIFVDIIPLDYFNSKYLIMDFDLFLKKIQRSLTKISNNTSKNKFKIHYVIHRILQFFSPVITPETPIFLFRKLITLKLKKVKSPNCRKIIGYGADSYWVRLFNVSHVFPLERIKFEDSYFPSPSNTHEVLKVFYGPSYLTPPKKVDRTNIHIKKAIIDTRNSISGEDIFYVDNENIINHNS